MRAAAFKHVRSLGQAGQLITSQTLKEGFDFEGQRIPLINPQRGIFKPRQMRFLLSIRTVYPKSGSRIWYDDQKLVNQRIFQGDEFVDYSFMGADPNAADNQWLKQAMENQIPIIYFVGVAPSLSMALFPSFIQRWDSETLSARVTFGTQNYDSISPPESTAVRRYAMQEVQYRLHQATFREAVLFAYGGRCALSGLPEPKLLDAAHIVQDKDEALGQPIVANGIPLSKLHHAAFDAHLVGVDADYKVHVSDQLLELRDGPVLEALKQMNGCKIILPPRKQDWPDRDRLAARFAEFHSSQR